MIAAGRAIDERYTKALSRSAVLILVVLGLAALVLDGGITFRQGLVALLAYLAMVAIIVVRRPNVPTASDLFAIGWLFPPLYTLIYLAASMR